MSNHELPTSNLPENEEELKKQVDEMVEMGLIDKNDAHKFYKKEKKS